MADVATGTLMEFLTSGFVAELQSVNGNDIAREAIETSHMATVGYKTFMPGDLIDPGGVECEFAFDPDARPPIDQPPEQLRVQFPAPPGKTNGAKVEGQGFVTNWSWGAALEEKLTASCTVKFSGAITWTDAS